MLISEQKPSFAAKNSEMGIKKIDYNVASDS